MVDPDWCWFANPDRDWNSKHIFFQIEAIVRKVVVPTNPHSFCMRDYFRGGSYKLKPNNLQHKTQPQIGLHPPIKQDLFTSRDSKIGVIAGRRGENVQILFLRNWKRSCAQTSDLWFWEKRKRRRSSLENLMDVKLGRWSRESDDKKLVHNSAISCDWSVDNSFWITRHF